MRAEGDASTLARMTAQAEQEPMTPQVPGKVDAGDVRTKASFLRFQVMLALREAREANRPLVEAVRALVSGDLTVGLASDPDEAYPDEAVAFDLVDSVAVAYSQLERWVASLEGRESLARLMTEFAPTSRRVMVAPDGHCWEMPLDAQAEFDEGVRASFESGHGELIELVLSPVDADDPDSLVRVEESGRGGDGVRMTVPVSLTRDGAALYRAVMSQRMGANQEGWVKLIAPGSGELYVVSPAGRLHNENMAPVRWPDTALHRWFPAHSPEPDATVSAVWSAGEYRLTIGGTRFDRVMRARQGCDLWKPEGYGDEDEGAMSWRDISTRFDLVDNDRFEGPRND